MKPLPAESDSPGSSTAWWALTVAWAIAVVSTLGALFIGEIMGLVPCVLCWYQRIAMFPLVTVLGLPLLLGASREALRNAAISGAALTGVGWLIASYHLALYWGWINPVFAPCGVGPSCKEAVLQIFGFVDVPLLSWLAFTSMGVALGFALRAGRGRF